MVVFDNSVQYRGAFEGEICQTLHCHHEVHFSKHLISPLPRKPHGITDRISKYVKFNFTPGHE